MVLSDMHKKRGCTACAMQPRRSSSIESKEWIRSDVSFSQKCIYDITSKNMRMDPSRHQSLLR